MSRAPQPPDPEIALPRLDSLEPAAERNVTLRVDRSAERALRQGHPWLFESGIRDQSHAGRMGDFAVIFDRNRNFLALGLYDPSSPIRVRILHQGKPTPVDPQFFERRIAALAKLRADLFAADPDATTGYRLVNGDNERMPGLVADRYGDTLVVKLYTAAWLSHLRGVLPALARASGADRIVLRWSRGTAAAGEAVGLPDGSVVYGPGLEGLVQFRENGLLFECDPLRGQKTGFFLDQRDNRARVERLTRGAEVLNAFSYSGGFSLYAARGGARSVVSLDSNRLALQAAERHFALNGGVFEVAQARHETLEGDAFRSLAELGQAGRRFDLVIVDPPSFAARKDAVSRALSAYGSLCALALGVLQPGGRLVMASCSSRVSAEDFYRQLHQSARRAGRPLREVERSGHAADHPIGYEQGAYLKCLFATAD